MNPIKHIVQASWMYQTGYIVQTVLDRISEESRLVSQERQEAKVEEEHVRQGVTQVEDIEERKEIVAWVIRVIIYLSGFY